MTQTGTDTTQPKQWKIPLVVGLIAACTGAAFMPVVSVIKHQLGKGASAQTDASYFKQELINRLTRGRVEIKAAHTSQQLHTRLQCYFALNDSGIFDYTVIPRYSKLPLVLVTRFLNKMYKKDDNTLIDAVAKLHYYSVYLSDTVTSADEFANIHSDVLDQIDTILMLAHFMNEDAITGMYRDGALYDTYFKYNH